MIYNDDKQKNNTPLDNRLGAPMKKIDGLSCDKKRSESEHLHAFREDIYIGNTKEGERKK